MIFLFALEPAIIVDIDGTIADEHLRRQQATVNGKIDWDIYFSPQLVLQDKPIKTARKALKKWASKGIKIFYVSSRPKSLLKTTKKWLEKNGFPKGKVYHRKKYQRTVDFKNKICAYLAKKYKVLFGVGDRKVDIEAYENAGIKAFKVESASDESWEKVLPEMEKLIP